MIQAGLLTQNKSFFSFKLGSFFPPQVYYCGVIGLAGAVYLLYLEHFFYSGMLMLLSALLVFTNKGVSVDLKNKLIKKFINVLGLSLGSDVPYQELNSLVLVKSRQSQTMHSRGSTTTIWFDLYRAFAVADQQKILLMESKRRGVIYKKLKALSDTAAIPIEEAW